MRGRSEIHLKVVLHMRWMPWGLAVVAVLLSAFAGLQLSAMLEMIGTRDAELAAFRERADQQLREINRLQETLRTRDYEVLRLLEQVGTQDQELADLRNQIERSLARNRVEISRSNLSVLAAALEHYFKNRGQYPAKLVDLVPKYLDVIPLEPCTETAYVYTPIGRPRLDYGLSTGGYPVSNDCASVAAGLSFAPALGLVNQP